MTLEKLLTPFPWHRYSKKLKKRILNARSAGSFSPADATARSMHLAFALEGEVEDGNCVAFYWLVDPEDGVVADARFKTYGQSALIGAADAACELVIGKNYDQARRLSTDLIDKHVRDQSDTPAFPPETYPHLNLVLLAIDKTAEECSELPLPEAYVAPPMTADLSEINEGGYPGWEEMGYAQRLSVIEQVLDSDIRPYIALDAGGVEVKEYNAEAHSLKITYQGNCTSCISAVGATLSYIQQIMRNKIDPQIAVIPEM